MAVLIVQVLVLLLVVSPGLAEGTPVPSSAVSDMGGEGVGDAGRVYFGQIFAGTVVQVAGRDVITTSDPDDNLPVILYDVEVSQTLKGEASGRVRIWYNGFDSVPFDYPGVGKLEVGQRYLFFAGFDPSVPIYPVIDGVGVIPIADDQEEAALLATFRPLIAAYEREHQGPAVPDPCANVGRPEARVSPQSAQPGETVIFTATNMVFPEASVWWDKPGTTRLAVGEVLTDCTLTVEVVIPKDAEPGKHRVLVSDARDDPAVAVVTVSE